MMLALELGSIDQHRLPNFRPVAIYLFQRYYSNPKIKKQVTLNTPVMG